MLSHLELLLSSHRRLLGGELILPGNPIARAQALWSAPYVVVSHGPGDDPCFTYANKQALELWEMDWDEFVGMPGRNSAQATERAERDRLLRNVSEHGFATGYSGVRASKSRRKFRIEDVTVWNLVDPDGTRRGQAASYSRWTYL